MQAIGVFLELLQVYSLIVFAHLQATFGQEYIPHNRRLKFSFCCLNVVYQLK